MGIKVLPDRESVRRLQMDEHVIIISILLLNYLGRQNLKKLTRLESRALPAEQFQGMKFFQIENRSVIDARRLQMDELVYNFNSVARLSRPTKPQVSHTPRASSTVH